MIVKVTKEIEKKSDLKKLISCFYNIGITYDINEYDVMNVYDEVLGIVDFPCITVSVYSGENHKLHSKNSPELFFIFDKNGGYIDVLSA